MTVPPANEYQEVLAHLRELLAPYVPANQAIEADSRLVDDLGLDSVQAMELLMAAEDRFDASIPVNFLPDVHTVDDLVRQLQQRLP